MSQFASPATPSSGVDWNEVNGSLILFQVVGIEEDIPNVHSVPGQKTPAVRATVTILDGPKAGQVHEDALVFPRVLQSQLKTRVGQLVLGRLGKGVAKPGHSAPWQLAAATPADVQVADDHMRKIATSAITTPGAQAPF